MESLRWIVIVISISLCQATSSLVKPVLKRVKRWEGTGDMSNMFRGTAGVDYPNYKTIPNTNFRCSDHQYEGGLYADVDTQCQVYHVCHDGRKDSFLCGMGTVFNQQILACDYWYSTECDTAPSFYHLNSQIGKPGPSWGGDSQGNAQANNQDSNYGQNYPQAENQGATHNQNYPPSSNEGTHYNQNNPQTSNNPGSYNPATRGDDSNDQYNPGPNNQGSNDPESYNPGTGGDGTNDQYDTGPNNQGSNDPGTYNPGTGGEGTNDQYNPGPNNQGSNDPGSYNPGTGGDGTNDQYNPGPNYQESNDPATGGDRTNYQGYNSNNEKDKNSETDQDGKSCCCLKNTYKAPWNFPAFPGYQSKK